jgi:hypothetical protein
MTFCQLIILSNCHCVKLPFCQLATLSISHYFNLLFCQIAILSNCHFVKLPFCQLAILSTCHFVNYPLVSLALEFNQPISWLVRTGTSIGDPVVWSLALKKLKINLLKNWVFRRVKFRRPSGLWQSIRSMISKVENVLNIWHYIFESMHLLIQLFTSNWNVNH